MAKTATVTVSMTDVDGVMGLIDAAWLLVQRTQWRYDVFKDGHYAGFRTKEDESEDEPMRLLKEALVKLGWKAASQ